MKISRFLARQYANPTGWFGKNFTARMLNRANSNSNMAVIDALALEQDHRLIEVGFGGADLLQSVVKSGRCSEVWGVERSQSMIDRADVLARRSSANGATRLLLGSVERLPVDSNYFDRVCSVNTIYFWKDLDLGASELARVAAPGGLVVLGFGSGEMLRQSGYAEKGFRFYDTERVHQAMQDMGLSLVSMQEIPRKDKDTFYVPVYKKRVSQKS